MNHDRRLDRLERAASPARTALTFLPIGIAGTQQEELWLADERERRGLRAGDNLVVFRWNEVEE